MVLIYCPQLVLVWTGLQPITLERRSVTKSQRPRKKILQFEQLANKKKMNSFDHLIQL